MPKQARTTDGIDQLANADQIRLILAIVEARSFSGAASALGVSQPSVSQQVKRLEALAGRTLFRRTRAGVELTNDGEAVVIYARAMLALTADLKRHFDQTAGVVKISIGMSEDFCRTALPTVLWLFMRDHPQVELRVISGGFQNLAAAIDAKTVDFAVMRRNARFGDASLLWSDELVWVGRRDFPQPVTDPVPLVLPIASTSPARDAPIETLRSAGRTWHVVFESNSLAGIEAAMEAGLGLCAAPRGMSFHSLETLDDRSGPPALPRVEFVMVEPGEGAAPAVLAFAEVLRLAATSSFRRPDGV